MERIVVVGAGLAGHRAALAVRSEGFTGELIIIGDERHQPYDRPPLSKQLLAGTFTPEQCFFPQADVAGTWLLGSPATALDTVARVVSLANGTDVHYDGLVIATGRRARQWPLSHGVAGVHTLRTIEDALAFQSSVAPDDKVVIIGAGFIGCEVAATLRSHGVESVFVVDVSRYPMPVLGEEVGARAALLHSQHGVQFRLESGVSEIVGERQVEAVALISGERLEADHVLVAVGSEPNSEWLLGSDVLLQAGAVVCDEYCAVLGLDGLALPGVVAAGDIAAWPHPHGGGPVCIEHWSNARDMAAHAVANLVGQRERTPFTAVPTFWSDQYHVKIKSAGFLRAADRFTVVSEDVDKPSLVVEAHRGDELVGAVVFNMNRTIIDYQRRLAAAHLVEIA